MELDFEEHHSASHTRRLEGDDENKEDPFEDIADEDLIIDYIPVKFETTFTPDDSSLFIPHVTTTEPKKHFSDIKVAYATGSESFNEANVF